MSDDEDAQAFDEIDKMLQNVPSAASPRKRATVASTSRSENLYSTIGALDRELKAKGLSGLTVFRDKVLEPSGLLKEIDDNELTFENGDSAEDRGLVVVVPHDAFFAASGRKTRLTITQGASEALADSTHARELAEQHIGAERIDDLPEAMGGHLGDDHEMLVRSVPSLWSAPQADENDNQTFTSLTFKGPRTKARHFYNPGSQPPSRGRLHVGDLDSGIVESEAVSSSRIQAPVAVAKIIAVRPFDKGHVVVVDRTLERQDELPRYTSPAKPGPASSSSSSRQFARRKMPTKL